MAPTVLCSPPSEVLSWMKENLSLSWGQVAQYFDASPRTVQRWRAGETEPSERNAATLDEIDELRWWVGRVFEHDPKAGAEWLTSRQVGFHGKAPVHLVMRGEVRRVIGVLAGDETGAFS
jgi:hypothetical protein